MANLSNLSKQVFPHNEPSGEATVAFAHPPGDHYEVRVPAAPEPCSYVRVVLIRHNIKRTSRGYGSRTEYECVYWDIDEWRTDDEDGATGAMGAIMGAITSVTTGRFDYRHL